MDGAFFQIVNTEILYPAIKWFLTFYPIWLPVFLGWIFIHQWLYYVRYLWKIKEGHVLMEIKLPREVFKSPHAMEYIFISLWQKSSGIWIDTYWKGKVRPWFSFEIASIDGYVHFYVWTIKKYKDLIESQFYAHYPGVEIHEAEDYTKHVHHDLSKMVMWGGQYEFELPDAYPLKTYVDLKLDATNVDEEQKVDPLLSLIEFAGSIRKGEQVWFQMIIQCHRKTGIKDGQLTNKKDWKKAALDEIQKIRDEAVITVGDHSFSEPTKLQMETIHAIERSLTKWPFEVVLRGIYIADKSVAKLLPTRVPGVIGAYRGFSGNYDGGFNGLKTADNITDFDYPWQDFMRIRRTRRERIMLESYKKRSYFTYPHKHWLTKPLIMTTEELATLFHLPGAVGATPTLERIQSKKSDAPANLPI